MADMKQIHDFAVKWCAKFRDQNINYIELVDHWMADDCRALGFDMDWGHTFFDRYKNAASDYRALEKIIDKVTDIPLLGSAIYSRWRYFNHWAYSGEDILAPHNRAWFILALSRLATLSGGYPLFFQGTLKKIRIISKNLFSNLVPELDKEVEQRLTINREGRVWFSGYKAGSGGEHYKKARSRNFKIDKAATNRLFESFEAYFSNGYTEILATNLGDWLMELTNTEGVTYKFRGPISIDLDYEGTDLSDLVRDTVGIDDLHVFDGNRKPDVIEKITLDYHRLTTIEPNQKPEGVDWEFVTWNYTERLIIDRKTQTLEHIQNIGTGCKVSRKYEIQDGIESLLEDFDAENLFSNVKGNSDDVIDSPNESKDYTIRIEYKKKPGRSISGSFDKNGLPEDFPEFAETVFRFIRFYGWGEILNPFVYSKVRRLKSEYIFCSVSFHEGYKTYYYLTDDDSIEVDDFVLVPAGKDNHEEIVEVVDIEYFSEENAPLPIEKTKRVIRKCTKEDFYPDKN